MYTHPQVLAAEQPVPVDEFDIGIGENGMKVAELEGSSGSSEVSEEEVRTRAGGTVCFHIIRNLETMHD